jgi:tetratricopeptide (TPR) repeat protein
MKRLGDSLREHERERNEKRGPLSRYEIIEELKRGGMGVVHRAWDRELGRTVALKLVADPAEAAPESQERLLQEAQLGARLAHPHIVPVYETGRWQGQFYMAMRFVEGGTIDRAGLDPRTIVNCIRDVARALDFAHRNHVIHRDVKPSNILVDKEGRAYVADFGVARRTDVPSKITLTGVILGTPSYMAPEQARGEPTDARSDVYSLGATLYELLTGRPPFQGDDPVRILLQVWRDDPPGPRRLEPSIDRDLETIVLKAMDKDPSRRYATAEDLALDLDRYLLRRPIEARRRSPAYRLRKWAVRHRWRLAAGFLGLALAGLAGGLWREKRQREARESEVVGLWKLGAAERDPDAAVRALEDALRRAEDPRFLWSKGKWDDLHADLASRRSYRDGLGLLSHGDVEGAVSLLEAAARRVPEALAPLEDARSRFRQELSDRIRRCEDLIGRREYPAAEEQLAVLEGRAGRVPGMTPWIREESRRLRAQLPEKGQRWLNDVEACRSLVQKGELEKAGASLDVLAKRLSNDPSVARLVGPHLEELRTEHAAARFDRELLRLSGLERPPDFRAAYESLAGPAYERLKDRDLKLAAAARSFAELQMKESRGAEAVAWFSEAARRGASDAALYERRGLARIWLGEWTGAEEDYRESVKRAPGNGPSPAGFAALFQRKARGSLGSKAWPEALSLLKEALRLDPRSAEAWYLHGLARFASGGPAEEALSDLGRALECAPGGRLPPVCRPDSSWGLSYRTVALAAARAAAEAGFREEDAGRRDASYRRCRAALTRVLEAEEPGSAELLVERARLSRRLREYREALADLERAPEDARTFLLRGQVRYVASDGKEKGLRDALADFDRALERAPGEAVLRYWRGICRAKLGLDALEDLKAASAAGIIDAIYHEAVLMRKPEESFALAGDAIAMAGVLSEDEYVAELHEHRGESLVRANRAFLRNAHFIRAKVAFEIGGKGMFERAAEDAGRALALDETGRFWWAHHVRGKSYVNLGRYREAVADLEKVLELLKPLELAEYDDVKEEARRFLEEAKKR